MVTVSRYAPAANTFTGGTSTGGSVNQSQSGTTSQSGSSSTQSSGQSTTDQSGSSHTSGSTSSQTNTQNMTGSSLAALELLIQQLLGGGTQEMAQQRAERGAEINQVQQTRAGYTKEAAFNDAQGLIAQTMRQTLEQLLPGINRAAQGSGTSQSSMRALLTQKAAENAAQAASAQGLQAATNYGTLNASFSNILEALTRPDNSTTQALLSALQTARGAVSSSSTTGTSESQTDSSQTSTTNSSQNSNTQSNQQGSSNTNTNRSSGTGTNYVAPSASNVDGLVYYGPQSSTVDLASTASRGTGESLATYLEQAAGGQAGWSDAFTF